MRYHTNVAVRESKKARSKAEYKANPEAKKTRSKARSKAEYKVNPEAKKARSKAEYQVNPEAKKTRSKAGSKAEYKVNPEAKKARSIAEYKVNSKAKKARSKARSMAEYKANPEAQNARSKALSRKAYLDAVKRARKIVSSRRYYSSAKVSISQYRKARYVLSEPKPSVQHLYVKSLKAKLSFPRFLMTPLLFGLCITER